MTCPSWPPPSGQAPLSMATSLGDSTAPAGVAARARPALPDVLALAAAAAAGVRLAVPALGATARAVCGDAVRRVATAVHSMPPHDGIPAQSGGALRVPVQRICPAPTYGWRL